MNKLIILITTIFLTFNIWAQSPEKMSYQSVIRNTNGVLVKNQNISLQISILQGNVSGTSVYTETHTTSTNANGLVSLAIGTGISSDNFGAIDWATGSYFIKTEIDPNGGTDYTITGTSQLLSVPYALHSKTAENGLSPKQTEAIAANTLKNSELPGNSSGDMKYWNGNAWVVIPATVNEGATLQMISGVPTWTGGTPPIQVGDYHQGGIVFWIDNNGGGLVCAIKSNGSSVFLNAESLAKSYKGGGFNDWYLPSRDELDKMYINKEVLENAALLNGGDKFSSYLWSSEPNYDSYLYDSGWYIVFRKGSWEASVEGDHSSVRAIRKF